MSRSGVIAFLLLALGASRVDATQADEDILLTARALSFVKDFNSDAVRVGVVRDPNNPQSVAEAREIGVAIGSGLNVAKIRMTVVDVSVNAIDQAAGFDVIWLTRGLHDYQRLVQVARAHHVLSVSSDLGCVEDGFCVLGIQSEPSVKIILSSSAAMRDGIAFQPAFRMMVTEQ